jgi:S1-C subfamily serine protease
VLGYDQATGFGLVQALAKLDLPALPLGDSTMIPLDEKVVIAGAGGRQRSVAARVVGKQEFAGYWEYVLDEAVYTAPAHPQWGGSALIGADGKLLALGSLLVQEKVDGGVLQGNMLVPIDLLDPILEDLTQTGRSSRPPRPWLGLYATEAGARLVVAGLAPNGPAENAGVKVGDVIVEVAGDKPLTLADLWRRVWRVGPPGVEVPIKLFRKDRAVTARLRSADRADFLKKPHLQHDLQLLFRQMSPRRTRLTEFVL